MARYEETHGSGSMMFGAAPFIGAMVYHGKEAKMARGTLGLTARAFGRTGTRGLTRTMSATAMGRPLADRLGRRFTEKGALTLARTHGVFRSSAWGAAKRAGLTGSLAKIAASRAAGLFFSAWNIAIFAPLLYSGIKGAVNTLRDIGRDTIGLEFGGDYVDTRGAYTERQRSLRAITSSRMSTRAAIGGEAQLFHR